MKDSSAPKAVVLLSGGMDSATTLAFAKRDGFDCWTLGIDYGQRHKVEQQRARDLAVRLGARKHVEIIVDLRSIGGSALTSDSAVPKDRDADQMAHGIPSTYVPARNTIMLSLALGLAESIGAHDLFIGANILDYSGYPDCRPEYLAAFETLANLATKAGVEGQKFRIRAPLIQMTKAQIIQTAGQLGVDLGATVSCYDPDASGRACGRCDSCQLRRKGFAEASVLDPTEYQ